MSINLKRCQISLLMILILCIPELRSDVTSEILLFPQGVTINLRKLFLGMPVTQNAFKAKAYKEQQRFTPKRGISSKSYIYV